MLCVSGALNKPVSNAGGSPFCSPKLALIIPASFHALPPLASRCQQIWVHGCITNDVPVLYTILSDRDALPSARSNQLWKIRDCRQLDTAIPGDNSTFLLH